MPFYTAPGWNPLEALEQLPIPERAAREKATYIGVDQLPPQLPSGSLAPTGENKRCMERQTGEQEVYRKVGGKRKGFLENWIREEVGGRRCSADWANACIVSTEGCRQGNSS